MAYRGNVLDKGLMLALSLHVRWVWTGAGVKTLQKFEDNTAQNPGIGVNSNPCSPPGWPSEGAIPLPASASPSVAGAWWNFGVCVCVINEVA